MHASIRDVGYQTNEMRTSLTLGDVSNAKVQKRDAIYDKRFDNVTDMTPC